MADLATWVLRSACHQVKDWQTRGRPGLPVSVNLSANQLLDPGLPKIVARVLAETGLDGSTLSLDVPESALVTDSERTADVLRQLRRLAVSIAIDDFGVGYSPLVSLKNLPIQSVKLHRSLVHQGVISPSDAGLVTSVVVMAHAMNLTVVAEGIETDVHLRFARSQGIDQVQGQLVSPPVEADKLSTQCSMKIGKC
jgi:EAL domain-containing protein (putative c-di-GMP-specific phosphodiesterase class I)